MRGDGGLTDSNLLEMTNSKKMVPPLLGWLVSPGSLINWGEAPGEGLVFRLGSAFLALHKQVGSTVWVIFRQQLPWVQSKCKQALGQRI